MRDPRLQHIAESSIEGGYVYTDIEGRETKFCGLLRILESLCYPTYDYKEALKSAPIERRFKLKTGLSRPWHGQKRGKLVHEQVRAIVNGGEVARKAMFGRQRSENAEFFIASLSKKHLSPLVSEYIVYDEMLQLASSIDLVCVTSKRRGSQLSLIELKNWSNGFTHSNGCLENPPSLRALSNCPLHQAFLQLTFYRRMVEMQHPHVPLGPCYVVQETQTFTKYFRLPDVFIAASREVFALVRDYRLSELLLKMSS